jgi:molybdopterin synthase catalytic subunit
VVALQDEPIQVERLLDDLAADGDGAVAAFVGRVRDRSAGRPVVGLAYHAWPEMALDELRKIEQRVRDEHGATAVRIVHRTGELRVGEVSVAIAVAAAHRAAALDACRLAIETLKRTVPIWKKERYADGSEAWIHGA